MPGIAIIISPKAKDANEQNLQRMLEVMHDEPFYTLGTFSDGSRGGYIGWKGHSGYLRNPMPLRSADESRLLFLFGGHYSDSPESSDASTARHLLDLFESRGIGALPLLNGWFHGVFIDTHKKEIVVFSDRYGMGRIYSHENANGFYFSSEAKSLLQIFPETKHLDEQGLAEWLSCGCVLQNRTLFSRISLLAPASAWTFSAEGGLKKDSYFSPSKWENQPELSA